ncbi:MAG: prephenate dehydrogenase/arogenate dehydrogenase family protein [Acidimicrobiales bacterium]
MTRRAGVVGLGLIGGSIGMALRDQGWVVIGSDTDDDACAAALEAGAIDEVGDTAQAEICFVATPVGQIAETVHSLLDSGAAVVTDVGSVKAPVSADVKDPRFVPGHPMAGNEMSGVRGSRSDLFHGAVWVLAPNDATSDQAYAVARGVIAALGADVVTIDAEAHDQLVAVVSHVPHLTAVTLMALADSRSLEHRPLLRLAAGGFRDMTRIAAGQSGIWLDICRQNSAAISAVLGQLIDDLSQIRDQVEADDRNGLLETLDRARQARINLPTGVPADVALAEVRVNIPDEPGQLAAITRLATDIDVNIYDLEIAHSVEAAGGLLIMIVPLEVAERLVGALMANGYRPSSRPLESE